jgi:NitT/TauT family transport system substrate-binding protein
LWSALYASYATSEGGTKVRMELPFAFTPEVRSLLEKGTSFLYANKAINTERLRPDAVIPQFAEAVLKERGMKSPIGNVPALSEALYAGK